MRAIPDEPFPEVGCPYTAVVSADGDWIAVNCSATARKPRVAVYRKSDLSLWDLVELDQVPEAVAFHPDLPLLAIGIEQGDEWERRGELVLYAPPSRRSVSFPFAEVGVTALRWLDARRLEVTLAEPDSGGERDGEDAYAQCVAERDDWRGVEEGDGELGFGPRVAVGYDDVSWGIVEPGSGRGDLLAALAAEAGQQWAYRDQVVAVEALRDGRLISVPRADGLLECWSASGARLWSVPVPDEFLHRSGSQLYVAPDERTAWVVVLVGDSSMRRTLLWRIALADGSLLTEHRLDFPAALSSRADGAWVARDSRDLFPPARWPPSESPVFTPAGRQLATVALGECDRSYDFRIRRSPHLLFLQGIGDEPHPEKWVVRVSPKGVEPLFPLWWERGRETGRIGGGPGVHVEDGPGPAIVHTCVTASGTYLARRALPYGEVVWTYRTDAAVTGVDAHAGLVHVVTDAKELLTLRAEDGKVMHRQPTAIGAYAFAPSSLSAAPGGELLIGTAEGRILICPAPRGVRGTTAQ
ncbi:PQQ-binding-like beta-propeller repeat protein [Streptomyces olivoreticuli]